MKKNNNIRRLFLTILFIVLCPAFTVFSQEKNREEKQEKEKSKKYAASFHILALMLEGGLKVDFSMSLTHKQWLQVTPAIYLYPNVVNSYTNDYYSESDYNYDEYDTKIKTASGAGMDIRYKYYLHSKRYFYLNVGINYSYFHVGYQYYDYYPFKEDGLNYYKYMKINENQYFNHLKVFTCMGIHTPMRKGFFVGGNLGVGYQYACYDDKKAALDNDVFDYGYRGFYPVIEFRMGFAW